MNQRLIQLARTYLHEYGYAFYFDARHNQFAYKRMGSNALYAPCGSGRIGASFNYCQIAYDYVLDIIGVPPEHRKPLTIKGAK